MNIYLIDDSVINLKMMKSMAEKIAGVKVFEFADPEAFRKLVEQQPLEHEPSLFIIDYIMPGINGIELAKFLRSHPEYKQAPILIATSADEKEVRYEALDAGANDYLTKPLDNREFLTRLKNMLALSEALRTQKQRSKDLAEEVQKATSKILDREKELLLRICMAAELRDPETGAHIQRMASYSYVLAKNLGLEPQICNLIMAAAPMHDVGKIGIPDHILLKPGKLTPEEFEIMKTHATVGHALLADSDAETIKAGAQIALTHHEKFDGSGYPNGLSGLDIPLFGRIVAVADVFDALTSERPYKKAWTNAEAFAFLKEQSGRHFDPAMVEAFLSSELEIAAIQALYA